MEILRSASLDAYLRTQAPDAPATLGVLTNARAGGRGWRHSHPRLRRALGPKTALVATHDLSELPDALTSLLLGRGVNVLLINGGDGTLHAVINELARWADTARTATSRELPLPRIVVVRGGTMNMVARQVGSPGPVVGAVQRWVQRCEGRRLDELTTRTLRILRVASGTETSYGCIFGTELVANALWVYSQFGEGYGGLVRLLVHASLGVRLNTTLWREYGHLLDPPSSSLRVDGRTYESYSAAFATTVELSIARGLIRAVPASSRDGFPSRVLVQTDKSRLLAMLPWLLRDAPHRDVHPSPHTHRIEAMGRYTLDGELLGEPGSSYRVELAPHELRVAVEGAATIDLDR